MNNKNNNSSKGIGFTRFTNTYIYNIEVARGY